MNFFNFITWLTTGAIIGWFASRMVEAERKREQAMMPGFIGDESE
ncbi:MAG: hypothetical protein ABFD29_10220 [Anaerolineaceae bacterium]